MGLEIIAFDAFVSDLEKRWPAIHGGATLQATC
jgi:hypothetical protein